MTLNIGDKACTTGLSSRIYAARLTADALGIPSDPSKHGPIKEDCYAIAKAVVEEITTNAAVIVAIGGLQTGVAPGAPTGPPAAPIVLKVT